VADVRSAEFEVLLSDKDFELLLHDSMRVRGCCDHEKNYSDFSAHQYLVISLGSGGMLTVRRKSSVKK
jgi:hypothetical protein